MRKSICLAIVVTLLACASCKKNNGPSAGTGEPTKENAVQVLKSLMTALETKDYDTAATLFQAPPQISAEDIKKAVPRILELNELSPQGIDILAAKGKWGKLAEVFGETRANRFVEQMKVPLDASYGLNYESAEAGFYWDGERFKIIRVDDIGKLK